MLAPGRARAACLNDPDGDGYSIGGSGAGCVQGAADCGPFDPDINPGEFETLADRIDNDCDGRDAMARYFSAGHFTLATWPGTGWFSYGPDGVTVGSTSQTLPSTVTRNLYLPRSRGATGVMLDVTSMSGAACYVVLDTAAWGTSFPLTSHSQQVLGAGTQWIPFPTVTPRHVLRNVQLRCYMNSQMTVDWLQVQNADEPVPPPQDMTLRWTDTRMPGGGYIESLVHDDQYQSLWMGTDVAGVAMGDRDGLGLWDIANGSGPNSLIMQGNLGVADIETMQSPFNGVYVLAGDVGGDARVLVGGPWWSDDDRGTWEQLASTWDDTYAEAAGIAGAGTGDDVGGFGLETNCLGGRTGGVTWEGAGGRLLQSDDFDVATPGSGEVIYIANADEDAMGVSIWDGTEACALPNDGTALPAEHVGALLRVDAPAYGTPLLLVGYRGRTDGEPGIYACELPAAAPLDCSVAAGSGAYCWALDGDTDGVDVRDLELDTYSEGLGELAVYVADGGTRPVDADGDGIGDATCDHAETALHRLELDDSTGTVVTTWVDTVAGEADLDMLSATSDFFMTDVSIDPASSYVFLNLGQASSSAQYSIDRMYRAPAGDVATGSPAWEAINSGETTPVAITDLDYYERVRQDEDLDLGGAWLESTINGRPAVFPARNAPGEAHSTVWVDGAFNTYAVVSGWANAWMVEGLDATWTDDETDEWGVADTDTVAQPEGDVAWTFWPDISPGFTYQTGVAHEVAFDSSGGIWFAVGDHGPAQYDPAAWEASGQGAAVDCLWKGWPAASRSVSVGIDDSVWFTLIDEADANSTTDGATVYGIQDMGVARTLDQGANWEYAGAAYESDSMDEATGERYCVDKDASHAAVPFDFGATGVTYPGTQFSQADPSSEDPTLATFPSLGNPSIVRALDANAALVLFKPNDDSDGGLYLTVDGGISWKAVPFDPGTGTNACSESLTWQAGNVELVHPGGDYTYWSEDATTGDVDWSLDLLVSVAVGSQYKSYWDSAGTGECSLARVLVTPDAAGAPQAAWSWIPLPTYAEADYASDTCGVSSRVLEAATIAPWSEDIVLWGHYIRDFDTTTSDRTQVKLRAGGACLLNWSDPAAGYWTSATGSYDTTTMLMNPAVDELGVGWVAPHPDVADLYAIFPSLTLTERKQCQVVRDTSTHASCPDFPYPRLASRLNDGSWNVTVQSTHPPTGLPNHAAWSHLGVADDQGGDGTGSWVAVATTGNGTWRAVIEW
ncbi:MAG: putative metal-binding motif-containing protein [Deltaproteobacteria bacterium]|nr:putative metal-binding motif-containing protein [Deltaproteobacteria bacterium]